MPDGVIYTTFLAGAGLDTGYAIALDHQGNAHITGETRFSDFPGVPPGASPARRMPSLRNSTPPALRCT